MIGIIQNKVKHKQLITKAINLVKTAACFNHQAHKNMQKASRME
jgi:hypothetical protein